MRNRLLLLSIAASAACGRPPTIQSPVPAADAAPSTDIYLYRFARLGRSSAVFNITNRRGYDNQPS
ncbi:MAG: hypothetical protein ACRENU_12245, partial [Gemmatimonadaceae bacterium]